MADETKEHESTAEAGPQTILIAHVAVHLVTGEDFELYPFVDDNDVKARVSELVEGWASSGFLLRGPRLYPWHQVRLIETLSVEEITHQEARQRLMSWEAADLARLQQSFWKTKKEAQPEQSKGEEGGH
jgi:hypothetical protein